MGRGQGGGGGRGRLAGGGGAATATATERAAAGEYVDPGIANDTLDPTLLGQALTDSDSAVIGDYTGVGFRKVNAYLEGYDFFGRVLKEGDIGDRGRNIVNNLPTALSKLPAKPGTSYRKLKMTAADAAEYVKQFKSGEGVNIKGFMSTTRDKNVFGNNDPGGPGNVFIVVRGKRGRDISSYSAVSWEQETLFTRNSKFAVTKVTQRSTGAYEIHLEQ